MHTILVLAVRMPLPKVSEQATYKKMFPKIHTSVFIGSGFGELVKDMEISLVFHLSNDTTLLQKIVCDLRTNGFSPVVEHDF